MPYSEPNDATFTQLVRMCSKSAAEKNLDAMGASCVQYAEQTYLQMFRRIVGLTIAQEGAMWMRRCLGHYIDLRRGSQRGESAYTWSRARVAQRQHT